MRPPWQRINSCSSTASLDARFRETTACDILESAARECERENSSRMVCVRPALRPPTPFEFAITCTDSAWPGLVVVLLGNGQFYDPSTRCFLDEVPCQVGDAVFSFRCLLPVCRERSELGAPGVEVRQERCPALSSSLSLHFPLIQGTFVRPSSQ